MTDGIEVVIIGAGQAGLAVSHELTQAGVAHVVLERGRVGQTWRGRWDSFCLVTPNWFCQLPGHPYDGSDPDGFMLRDEVVAYLERYAAGFDAPVREGVEVTALRPGRRRRLPPGDLGRTRSWQGRWSSAPAPTSVPTGPAAAATLPADLLQIDVEDYRNPADLPPGPVLVVGSGQSGCQIAEELHQAGREVFLACGRAPWFPRRLGDRDLAWWALETGFLDAPLSSLPSPAARLAANVQATGAGGGHDLHYRTLRKMGVTLLGHFLGADGRRARFAPDLGESVAWGDERNAQLMDLVRKLVAERGLPRPEIPEPEPFNADSPEELNLERLRGGRVRGWLSARLRVVGSLPGRVRRARLPDPRGGSQHRRAQGSTSSASTSCASAGHRCSTGSARTPPSSPARSPRDRSNQPRELANGQPTRRWGSANHLFGAHSPRPDPSIMPPASSRATGPRIALHGRSRPGVSDAECSFQAKARARSLVNDGFGRLRAIGRTPREARRVDCWRAGRAARNAHAHFSRLKRGDVTRRCPSRRSSRSIALSSPVRASAGGMPGPSHASASCDAPARVGRDRSLPAATEHCWDRRASRRAASGARVAAAAGAVRRDCVAVRARRGAEASRPVAREVEDEAVAAIVGAHRQAREFVGADDVDHRHRAFDDDTAIEGRVGRRGVDVPVEPVVAHELRERVGLGEHRVDEFGCSVPIRRQQLAQDGAQCTQRRELASSPSCLPV